MFPPSPVSSINTTSLALEPIVWIMANAFNLVLETVKPGPPMKNPSPVRGQTVS
jgi:hypothetical protein